VLVAAGSNFPGHLPFKLAAQTSSISRHPVFDSHVAEGATGSGGNLRYPVATKVLSWEYKGGADSFGQQITTDARFVIWKAGSVKEPDGGLRGLIEWSPVKQSAWPS
jgi:hypothetical protein